MDASILLTWKEKPVFLNKDPFPAQLTGCLVSRSGSGKTKLLYKLLLSDYLDYNKLVLCSPSLSQIESQVIRKSFKHGLNKEQILELSKSQDKIGNIDGALRILGKQINKQPGQVEIITYNTPDDLPQPDKLNPKGLKKVLVLIDD